MNERLSVQRRSNRTLRGIFGIIGFLCITSSVAVTLSIVVPESLQPVENYMIHYYLGLYMASFSLVVTLTGGFYYLKRSIRLS